MRVKSRQHWDAIYTHQGPKPLEEAELEELKQLTPKAWWKKLEARCPCCGEAGLRVSTVFEAPPQKDVKAWKQLKE